MSRRDIYIATYMGSKLRLIRDIQRLMPLGTNKLYEVCGGFGAFILNKHWAFNRAIYNELNPKIQNVLLVLKDDRMSEKLIAEITETSVTEEVFLNAKMNYENDFKDIKDPVEQAKIVLILQMYSYNAVKLNYIERLRTDEWKRSTRRRLRKVHEALQNIEILNRDCFDIIREVKKDDEAFVLYDPPYKLDKIEGFVTADTNTLYRTTKNIYGKEDWSDEDHRKNIELLKDIDGNIGCKILMFSYPTPTYDVLLDTGYWNRIDVKDLPSPGGSKGNKRSIKPECVYLNYTCIPKTAEYHYFIDIDDMILKNS